MYGNNLKSQNYGRIWNFLETLCDALTFHTCFSHKKRLGQVWNLLFFHQKGVNPDIEGIICTWFGGTESRFYFVGATKRRIHLCSMKFFKDAMGGQVADGFILKPNYLKE